MAVPPNAIRAAEMMTSFGKPTRRETPTVINRKIGPEE